MSQSSRWSLKQIDLFGRKVELGLGEKISHKTWCGTFISILVIASSAFSVFYYAEILLERENPSIFWNEIFDKKEEGSSASNLKSFNDLQVNSDSFFILIGIENEISENTNKMQSQSMQLTSNEVSAIASNRDSIQQTIKMVSCSDLDYFQNILQDKQLQYRSDLYNVLQNSNFLCLIPQSIPFINEEGSQLQLSFKCNEQTNLNCSLIQEKIVLLTSDYQLNSQNLSQPLIQSTQVHRLKKQSQVDIYLQKVTIETDIGHISKVYQNQKQFIFSHQTQFDLPESSSSSLIVNFHPHPKRINYSVKNYFHKK